jgi:hypothetical protein
MPDPTSPDDPFAGFEILSVYSRADALADGVLVDLTDLAREAGFRIPLAVTEAVYRSYLDPSPELIAEGQSFQGRAWDLLQILRFAAAVYPDRSEIHFKVLFVLSPGCSPEPVPLKALCHPGDDGEPVLTILLPSED